MMSVGRIFSNAVERYPSRTAIVDPTAGRSYSYEEWDRRIHRVASALKAAGVGDGDRVGVLSENSIEASTLFWATQYCGATFVPYNIKLSTNDVAYLLEHSNPNLLFFSDEARETVKSADHPLAPAQLVAVGEATGDETSFESFVETGTAEFTPTFAPNDATSLILHSSGTTGRPKGIPWSQESAYASALSQMKYSRWEKCQRTLNIMPIYHAVGMQDQTTTALLSGTLVVLSSTDPADVLGTIDNYDVNGFFMITTMLHKLAESAEIDAAELSSVTSIMSHTLPKYLETAVREQFDPKWLVNIYGATELYSICNCDWLDEKSMCAGRASVNTRVRIIEEGEDVPPDRLVEQGEQGQIIVDASSPEAAEGYLDYPETNEVLFENGWYYTGDVGYRDEDGDLFLLGRKDDMIQSGGENIYPIEIQDVIEEHDAVAEVAVVGRDHEMWGEVVTAFLVPESDATDDYDALAADIDQYCADRRDLANFKRPKVYVFVPEIPKSRIGKKLRRKLEGDIDAVDVLAEVDRS